MPADTTLPARGGFVSMSSAAWLVWPLATAASFFVLRLDIRDLVPTSAGLAFGGEFLGASLRPAIMYEAPVPIGTEPLIFKAVDAAWTTVLFAVRAMSIAVPAGAAFGMCGSTAWWLGGVSGPATFGHRVRRVQRVFAYSLARLTMTGLRSIHELLWGVLLLAAVGLGQLPAILAIAIPYTGILAKVFSEILDETPRDAAMALCEAGASELQMFVFGLLPRAAPDMAAYACYRFECAIRASAVLGFFGIPTVGYYIAASFENLHLHEVWTYLYVLFGLVIAVDWWSGTLRRKLLS